MWRLSTDAEGVAEFPPRLAQSPGGSSMVGAGSAYRYKHVYAMSLNFWQFVED